MVDIRRRDRLGLHRRRDSSFTGRQPRSLGKSRSCRHGSSGSARRCRCRFRSWQRRSWWRSGSP